MERFMVRAESALDGIGFFRGSQRENVLRTLRRVIRNAEVDTQELATLWGIFAQVDRLAKGAARAPKAPAGSDDHDS
jgi:tRNA C32,U32 (ribose-2'-O)-methylase TrmJ